jgi:hypothetical protein
MPPPYRLSPDVIADALARRFPSREVLVPSAALSRSAVDRCRSHGVTGGAVYDAIVALTAAEAKAVLLTRNARAARTYARLGVEFTLLE